jgi:hypothetical protein
MQPVFQNLKKNFLFKIIVNVQYMLLVYKSLHVLWSRCQFSEL